MENLFLRVLTLSLTASLVLLPLLALAPRLHHRYAGRTFYVLCLVLAVLVWVFVRDYPEEKGAFPDNDKHFDRADAEAELKAGLEYMKHSPWTSSKLLHTPTVWKMVVSLGVMELLSLGGAVSWEEYYRLQVELTGPERVQKMLNLHRLDA